MVQLCEGKLGRLQDILREMKSALIAFSGGVDSTFLLKVARDVLGERALGVTAVSPSLAADQLEKSKALAQGMGAQHLLIRTHEVESETYADNPPNRCYFCKEELYTQLVGVAREHSIQWIADGNTKSDEGDWRPGRRAAREFGVRSPLLEAGLFKDEIRELSRQLGLETWDEPASPCLSSRIPYGEKVTMDKLRMIEEGEKALKDMGVRHVRLRHHGADLARLEVGPDEMKRFVDPEFRKAVSDRLRKIGYAYVSLDLEGYRSGSLNEALGMRPGCARGKQDAGR